MNTQVDSAALLTAREVAAQLKCSTRHLTAIRALLRPIHLRPGGRAIRYRREDVDRYLAGRAADATTPQSAA